MKSTAAPRILSPLLPQFFAKLVAKYDILTRLDEFAIDRLLQITYRAKSLLSKVKGQSLEELTECRIVPWLNKIGGTFPLGASWTGKKLNLLRVI